MNLLKKLDSSNCELVRDENLKKYNALAIKEGETQIKTVEDVYPCLEIEVFDNGEVWISCEGCDEQRSYNAEKKGILIIEIDDIDISVKIEELFKEDEDEDKDKNEKALELIIELGFNFNSVKDLLGQLADDDTLYGEDYNLMVEVDDMDQITSIEQQPNVPNKIIWEREGA